MFWGEIARVDRNGASLAQITHATPAPAWTGIQIRRTSDNQILSSFATTRMPQWVAVSRDRLALLDRRRIELHRLSGQLIRSFAVSAHVSEISMSGNWIAYLDGTAIDALDALGEHALRLASGRRLRVHDLQGEHRARSVRGRGAASANRIPRAAAQRIHERLSRPGRARRG